MTHGSMSYFCPSAIPRRIHDNLSKSQIFVDIFFSVDKVGTLTGGGTDYFRDSSLLFVPAILFLVIMFLGCCPIWIIFNCCENCWYKKRKVHKNFIPWVVFGIWALLYVVYIIVSTSTLINFTEMTGGMVQAVCDIGGSILKIVEWFKEIADIALNLGTQLGATISESNKTIFRTLDKLEADVNGLKQDVDAVVLTITTASSAITAALKDADLADKDIQLPASDLQQIVNDAFGQGGIPSIITAARNSASDTMGSVADTVQSFPNILNDTMASAQQSFETIHRDAFGEGAGIELFVPGLIADEKVNMRGAVLKIMNAIMMVVNLITIPAMAYFPFLLAGGISIAVAFKFCFPSERWACCGRCVSKCGGVMLWLGVMLLLVYNIVFLVVYVMYDDLCTVVVEPNLLVSYAREAYPEQIKQFIPTPPQTTG